MLKNISQLEVKIAEKIYHLTCDNDSPLEHVKEALCQFLKYVGNIEDQIKASQSKVEPISDVNEESKPAE